MDLQTPFLFLPYFPITPYSAGKVLPFSQFSDDGSMQGKIALLMSTFTDVIETHDPVRSGGLGAILMEAL